jgi:hypothetical protein
MKTRLIEIESIPPEWQQEHPIRALVINDRSYSYAELVAWPRTEPSDWTKLSHAFMRIGTSYRVFDENCVKTDDYGNNKQAKAKDKNPRIHELRAKRANGRVFFYYEPNATGRNETIVCTNVYRKSEGEGIRQTRAFELARRLRDIRLQEIGYDSENRKIKELKKSDRPQTGKRKK